MPQGPQKQSLAHAILDTSTFNWLDDFPYWDKALQFNNFPDLVEWINELDPILAANLALREKEYRLAYAEVKQLYDRKTAEKASAVSQDRG